MQHIYPQPRPETVERVRRIYREKYGRDLTYAEAHQVLYAVIRFLWLSGHPLNAPAENGPAPRSDAGDAGDTEA